MSGVLTTFAKCRSPPEKWDFVTPWRKTNPQGKRHQCATLWSVKQENYGKEEEMEKVRKARGHRAGGHWGPPWNYLLYEHGAHLHMDTLGTTENALPSM